MRPSIAMMTKMNNYFSPNKIVFGNGAVSQVGKEAGKFGAKKALIVTDKGVLKAGNLKGVEESLKAQRIDFIVFDKVEAEPPARVVDECGRLVREEGVDLVIGIGGGSSMDTAKGAALLARNPGKVVDYAGFDKAPQRGLPKILLPTTAGTGSEVTRNFVITDEEENAKKVIFTDFGLADVAIVDPMLTVSCPPAVTADTGMDALVHAIETFVSVNATPFSDVLAIEAISLIGEYLPIACVKGENLEARYNMALGATLSGLAFGSGGLGAVHALAYVLGTEYHLSHGRTNAIMLPYVVDYNLTASPARYARIAQAMGENIDGLTNDEAAGLLVEHLFRLLEVVGIPSTLGEYGITEKALDKLVAGGMEFSRLFIPNPRNLTEADVREIYTNALE
ncbi:MAG: iron-containing alcohol dehydrogenase [Chloroflexota bacterium]